jgi:hypothetical protein
MAAAGITGTVRPPGGPLFNTASRPRAGRAHWLHVFGPLDVGKSSVLQGTNRERKQKKREKRGRAHGAGGWAQGARDMLHTGRRWRSPFAPSETSDIP